MEVVSSYVTKNSVSVDQLGGLIATVHQTLSGLATKTTTPALALEKLAPAVPIRRSVQPDYVVCLECGFQAKTPRRHLRMSHGLDPPGVSGPLEIVARSSADGTGLLRAPLDVPRAADQPGELVGDAQGYVHPDTLTGGAGQVKKDYPIKDIIIYSRSVPLPAVGCRFRTAGATTSSRPTP